MLTADQISQIRTAAGADPLPQNTGQKSLVDILSGFDQKRYSPTQDLLKVGKNMFGEVAQQFNQGAQQVRSGIDKIRSGGSPIEGAEAGVSVESGLASAVTSPLAPIFNKVNQGVKYVTNKITDNPAVQKAALKLPELPYERLAQDTGNVGNVAGTLSMIKAPAIAGSVAKPVASAVEGTKNIIDAGTSKMVDAAPHPIDVLKGYADTKVRAGIEEDVASLLKSTRTVGNKSAQATKTGTDLHPILSDPQIFKGLKVENGKINPDEAIATIDSRIDPLLEAKRGILPKVDEIVPTTPRKVIRDRAKEFINNGVNARADKDAAIERMDKQLAAYPEQMKPSQIDQLRADMRGSARDAKGQLKSDSEYAALENAARDTVFDITDELPVSNAGEYKALNDYIKQMITTKGFLDKTLRNQVVKGGRMQGYSMKLLGTIAGGSHGPLGALVGHGIGGVVADIITNNQLGSSFKMSLIQSLTDDPAILAQAQKLLADIKDVPTPTLPAGSNDARLNGNEPVQVAPKDQGAKQSEYVGSDTRIGDYQSSPKNALPNAEAANKNTISPSTNNIKVSIPQEAQSAIDRHLVSAEQVLKNSKLSFDDFITQKKQGVIDSLKQEGMAPNQPKGWYEGQARDAAKSFGDRWKSEYDSLKGGIEGKGGIPALLEQTKNNIADGLEAQGFKDIAEHIRNFDLKPFTDFESFKKAILEYVKNIQPGLSMKNVGPNPLSVAQKIGGEDISLIQDFVNGPTMNNFMRLQPILDGEKGLGDLPIETLQKFFRDVMQERNSPDFKPIDIK